jgi:PAS domain S-box-containing protein
LTEENSRLAHIVRSWPDAIVGESSDGVVTSWNRAAEHLYGYRADDIIGRPVDLLYPAECRSEEATTLCRAAGADYPYEYLAQRIRRDGSSVTVSVRTWSIVDDLGGGPGYVSVAREMIEPGGPGARLGGLGHQLRTPLQAIIGFTGTLLLRMPGPLTDEQERQLLHIQASGQKLLALINELGR